MTNFTRVRSLRLVLVAALGALALGGSSPDHAVAQTKRQTKLAGKRYAQMVAVAHRVDPAVGQTLEKKRVETRLALRACQAAGKKKKKACRKAALAEWAGYVQDEFIPWYKKHARAGLKADAEKRKAKAEKRKAKRAARKARKAAKRAQ